MLKKQIIIPDQIFYYPNFLSESENKEIKLCMESSIVWTQGLIKIFGREVLTPRLQSWIADDGITYTYSGKENIPEQWPKELIKLRTRINKEFNLNLNSALCNLYRNGNDSNGWHSDDEKELGKNPVIASISLGVERKFQLKCKKTNERIDLNLESGSLLIMKGNSQSQWKHQIPKQRKIEGKRYNITFRETFKKISKSQS
tara:strand:+ start:55273 stop:55875 length:603 start_codon:yes stop_codon:yes gene_type:complete